MVDTFNTGKFSNSDIEKLVKEHFDLRPAAIIDKLELRKPQYKALSCYGHMGREDLGVAWEKTDMAETLKKAAETLHAKL
jgi:S-adenosylmethionine synthetase